MVITPEEATVLINKYMMDNPKLTKKQAQKRLEENYYLEGVSYQ